MAPETAGRRASGNVAGRARSASPEPEVASHWTRDRNCHVAAIGAGTMADASVELPSLEAATCSVRCGVEPASPPWDSGAVDGAGAPE